MNFKIITTTSELEEVCLLASASHVVMLDTEFVRTRTFYPQLGLIQLYDGKLVSLIDPFLIEDMRPFVDLLNDKQVLKVLHACGEDLEVFQHQFQTLPEPMIDTQIMAAFLGHGLSMGFASLVDTYLALQLDKGESRSNWCHRPLTSSQLNYAAADVYYLWPLYHKLNELLSNTKWQEAALTESYHFSQKRTKKISPDKAYLNVKGHSYLQLEQLVILKALAAWRFKEAKKSDLALGFVMKDADLIEIAKNKVKSISDLKTLNIDSLKLPRYGEVLLTTLKAAGEEVITQEQKQALLSARLVDEPKYKQMFKELKKVVTQAAIKYQLAPEFLASKKQIHQFMVWVWQKDKTSSDLPDLMLNWRYDIVGKDLVEKIEA